MEIGRNTLCPCGSGKKYKKCCGATLNVVPPEIGEAKYFEFNKEIAYKGEIGKKRKDFCLRYIENKKKAYESILQDTQKEAVAKGDTITCSKGCSYCCTQYIVGSIQVCESIVYYLYQNQRVLQLFLDKYPIWRKEVGKHEELHNKISDAFHEKSIYQKYSARKDQLLNEWSNDYTRLNIPCPFLDDNLCSIYEIRPLSCAGSFSASPKEYCNPSSLERGKMYRNTPRSYFTSEIEHTFYYGSKFLLYETNVPIGVYEILKRGFDYLSSILGLSGLSKAAMNDPEVKMIVKSYIAKEG